MSDPFTVRENKGGDFDKVPCGAQHAIASKLYDLGWQPGYQGGRPTHQIVVLFELCKRMTKGDFAGQRFRVTQQYNATLGSEDKPSKLRTHLVSWKGKEFTPEQVAGFDLRGILGKHCTLSLIETKKADGKTFAKIVGIMPRMQGTEDMKDEAPVDFIPEWVQKRQQQQLMAPPTDEAHTSPAAGAPATDFEDDIPF